MGPLRAVLLLTALLLGGCWQAPAPDVSLRLTPSSLEVQQGQSGSTQLTLTPQNGFSGTVTLSLQGAPSGVTLFPLSVTVNNTTIQPLTLSVGAGVNPGTYPLRVRGTAGNLVREADLTLTVQSAPSPDFSMVLESDTLSLAPGGTAYVRLSVTGSGDTLTLQLVNGQGSPFTPVTLSPPSTPIPSAPVLELRSSPSLAPGTYPLRVRGTSGALTKEVGLTLQVNGQTGQNLSIAKAEWGQSVLKDTLRLVAGKEALLRVHLVASPSPISLSAPLSGAVYEGSAFRGNLTFTCPNPLPTATLQGDLATTCRAILPASWVTPGLRVELRADPNNQVAETDEADNARTLTPEVGAGTVLHLTVVPVVHQGVTATVPSFSETLLAVWPLKDVTYTTRAPYAYAGTLSATDSNAWADLLDELRLLRQADSSGRYYYGFVRVGYTSGIAGIGYIGFPVAAGWDYASSAPAVMAHELGHNFGREHAPCGVSGDPNYPYPNGTLGTWGYDRRNGTLKDPSTYRDLMSYCSPLWISDYTYGGAQGFLETNPPEPQGLSLGLEEKLLFTALAADGRVELRPPLLGPFRPEGRPSSYRLEADGVSHPVYALEDSEGHLHLEALLPVQDYRRLALYEGSRLLLERTASLAPQAAPQVDLRVEGEEVAVRVQGGTHFHLAHLAPDGTRTTLALFHPVGEARFPIRGLPPGGRYEVQVTEGLRVVRFLRP